MIIFYSGWNFKGMTRKIVVVDFFDILRGSFLVPAGKIAL